MIVLISFGVDVDSNLENRLATCTDLLYIVGMFIGAP